MFRPSNAKATTKSVDEIRVDPRPTSWVLNTLVAKAQNIKPRAVERILLAIKYDEFLYSESPIIFL